ncbi:MAG: mitochondrial fission ELM1 family protein [Alphaproteobacteria bacterium]|nr:mitochondrial fission ELM1 family protein [Alphaproteobacteria bacterium]
MTTVWVLADDRAGNVNQLLGVAEALNTPYERKDIRYNKWVHLPNFLRGASLIGLTNDSKEVLTFPWPNIVLSAGRRSFPVARWIKRQSKGHTKIIQLMNVGWAGFNEADLMVIPAHDSYSGHAKNVLRVSGAPHRITLEKLQVEYNKWQSKFGKFDHPALSLIVGGATKDKPFTTDMAHQLMDGVLALNPASILVTTSRRTPKDVIEVIRSRLPKHSYLYQFGDTDENPYFGLLAHADTIVVTGDSISMCSECCATSADVYIFAPDSMMSEKHKRFHQDLYSSGHAAPLGQKKQVKRPDTPFNPAYEIANTIKQR